MQKLLPIIVGMLALSACSEASKLEQEYQNSKDASAYGMACGKAQKLIEMAIERGDKDETERWSSAARSDCALARLNGQAVQVQ